MARLRAKSISLWLIIFFFSLSFPVGTAQGEMYFNRLQSPIKVKIRAEKEIFNLGEPIKGTIVLDNTYPANISAVFVVTLFHDGSAAFQVTTSLKHIPAGPLKFSFREFGIPPFYDDPAAAGVWRIVVAQVAVDPSFGKEMTLRIIPK